MTAIPEIAALLKLARQPGAEGVPCARAALLADTASQLLAGTLKGYAKHLGFRLELFEGEFDQIEMAVLDPASALHAFRPETVIIHLAAERIAAKFGTLSVAERGGYAEAFGERARRLHQALANRGYQTLFFNLADPGDGVFGNYGNKAAWSLRNQIRLCNVELMRLAMETSDFHVYDLTALQSAMGRAAMFDAKIYFTSKFALTPEILPLVARDLAQMLAARMGIFRKCVILDLDNTLWGGVVADDGLDRIQIGDLGLGPAFTAFQSC